MPACRMKSTPDPTLPTDLHSPSNPSAPDDNDCEGFKCANRTHEEIQHRAHSMWVSAGRPEHREVADWLAAEAEVRGER